MIQVNRLLIGLMLSFFLLWGDCTVVATATESKASLTILEDSSWETLQEGYKLKRILARRSTDGRSFEVLFLRFDPGNFSVAIQKADKGENLFVNQFSELKGDDIAVINGGYFDHTGNPLGFLKIEGKVFASHIARHRLYSGFLVPDSSSLVVHRSQFKPSDAKSALQVGPLLVRNGKKNPGLLNADSVHYRSGIAVDRSGNFILYVTDTKYGGISWNDLLKLLLKPEFDILNALNLDGGASTQLYYKKNGVRELVHGLNTVPTALVIRQKNGNE